MTGYEISSDPLTGGMPTRHVQLPPAPACPSWCQETHRGAVSGWEDVRGHRDGVEAGQTCIALRTVHGVHIQRTRFASYDSANGKGVIVEPGGVRIDSEAGELTVTQTREVVAALLEAVSLTD